VSHGGIARPETEAAHLLRVSFSRNRIRQMWNTARVRRCGADQRNGSPRDQSCPEKIHRTCICRRTVSGILEIRGRFAAGRAKTDFCIFWIVGSMLVVLIEWNREFNLVRRRVNRRMILSFAERGHDLAIKCRNRFWAQSITCTAPSLFRMRNL